MFELNVIEDVVLTYCPGIVISAVLGRNSQNKPNGFSIHVVLRSGAEIIIYNICGLKIHLSDFFKALMS